MIFLIFFFIGLENQKDEEIDISEFTSFLVVKSDYQNSGQAL